MVESFKNYSKLINLVVFICGLITFLGVENLRTVIPENFQYLIPVIVLSAGYILVQLSEDKRVERAENIAISSSNNNLGGGDSNGGDRKL